ncbi:MAG: glutaredoxin family protein, partial [Alphaproteobacteria bacterium]
MTFIKNFIADLKEDKVRAAALCLCLALFVWVGFFKTSGSDLMPADSTGSVQLYHTNGCPHCAQAIEFIDTQLQTEFPAKIIQKLELSEISAQQRGTFLEFAEQHNIKGVPVLRSGDVFVVGFNADSYRSLMKGELKENETHASCAYGEGGDCEAPEELGEITAEDIAKALGKEPPKPSRIVDLPYFGEIDVFQESIPFLAIVLGLVDGF